MWYYDSCQLDAPKITKANIAIQMAHIYKYQPNTWTELDFHAQYLKKIFQYSNKYKNLKEQRKT
jgi:hypothetical protein